MCTLLNDVMCYCNHTNSPFYVCSLDADKCFDSIWHPALFYKLNDKIAHTFYRSLVNKKFVDPPNLRTTPA